MPKTPATFPPLRTSYEALPARGPLDEDVLVAVAFGSQATTTDDQRCLRIDLEPLAGMACVEVWRGRGPARTAVDGLVRYAEDGEHCVGHLSIDESATGSLTAATESAYRNRLGKPCLRGTDRGPDWDMGALQAGLGLRQFI